MFCSQCGTKVNDGAKFCFNCGARIVGAVSETAIEIEKKIPEEFVMYVENKCVEAYIQGNKLLPETFYKKAEFYEVEKDQVKKIVSKCEEKIGKIESFIGSMYEECEEFELSEDEYDEIIIFGNSLDFDDEDIDEIINCYEKKSGISKLREEKEKKKNLESMTFFELYGEQIGYTQEECVGIKVGRSYRKVFHRINNEFLEFYNNNDCTKDGYWDAVNKKVVFLIDAIYKAMCSTLEARGISKEDISYIEYMEIFKYWIQVFEDVDYKYNVICCGTDAAEYYRKIRKATRTKLVGGGFGLDGALKGIATAGAINMMTGATHSAFNFVGNIKSEWKKLQAIKELFGYSLRDEIVIVFQKTIQLAYMLELEIIKKYGVQNIGYQLFYKEGNIYEGDFEVEAIKNNPFDISLYGNAIKTRGDSSRQLERIADFTGIEIEKIKEIHINDKFSNIKLDENNAQKIFEDIHREKDYLGYTKTSRIEAELSKIKREMDEEKVSVYDVELFRDMRGSFGKPKLINGQKWIYRDKEKLQEMREKREEFVSAYNTMKTSDIKSMGETLEILARISSEYGFGKSVVSNLNAYILTKIVTSEMYLDRNGYIKVEQIGVFQCTTVDEYLRVGRIRKQILEKYECDYITPYRAYEVYKDLKQLITCEGWGNRLLISVHDKIDWEYTLRTYTKKFTEIEMYNDLICTEKEIILDIPKLELKESTFEVKLREGDKIHYSTKEEALEILRFNKYAAIVISSIDTLKEKEYANKIQLILDKKPACLKDEFFLEQLRKKQELLQKTDSIQRTQNKDNSASQSVLCQTTKNDNNVVNSKNDWDEKYSLAKKIEDEATYAHEFKPALAIYEELASLGMAKAQWRLAICYRKGTTIDKNINKAVELFTKAAEQGYADAMNALGSMYFGVGGKTECEVDNAKAFYWFSEAAKLGNAGAQYNLYLYYKCIEKDSQKEMYWLTVAAENNQATAQEHLGETYLDNDIVAQDYQKAVYWFKKAAANGNRDAQYNLGVCYMYGHGVEVSKDEALRWFTLAEKNGHPEAARGVKKLKGGCYITSAVCKSFGKPDDCYELQSFRKFRDEWLKLQPNGQLLIDEYYCTAPQIVERIEDKVDAKIIYDEIWNKYLKECLGYIETNENEKCKELYTEMVYDLKNQYYK